MKKSFSLILKDQDNDQIALNLFNTSSIDIAKRIARKSCIAFSAAHFELYDLDDTSNGDISTGKLILHG